jgi:hypothetical protein
VTGAGRAAPPASRTFPQWAAAALASRAALLVAMIFCCSWAGTFSVVRHGHVVGAAAPVMDLRVEA